MANLKDATDYAKHLAFHREGGIGRFIVYQIHDGQRYAVGRPRGASDPAWADWLALYWYEGDGRSGVCI